jgi:hypothetical protein
MWHVEGEEEYVQDFWWRNLRERDHLEDPGLYLRVILKCILHKFNRMA